MIYQYDLALEMPTMNVYDTGMLGSYITALKDEYNRGLADQKEFMTKYGDFSSPISKDVEWWNNTVNKPVHDFISKASEAGIDMRSPEFRMALANLTNGMPYAEMNARKQYAKNAEEYKKNRDYLIRQGKYNPDFERSILGGNTLENWDTSTMGGWTRTSPEMLTDLTTFSKDAVKGLKDSYLRSDGKYDYVGVTDDTVRKTIGEKLPDYLNSPSGQYYLQDIAKRRNYNLDDPYQKELAEKELLNDAVNRSAGAHETREANAYALLAQKQAYEKEIAAIRAAGSGSDGTKLSKSERTAKEAKAALDSAGYCNSDELEFQPVGNVKKMTLDNKSGDATIKNLRMYQSGLGGATAAYLYRWDSRTGSMMRLLNSSMGGQYMDDGKIIKKGKYYYLQVTPQRIPTAEQMKSGKVAPYYVNDIGPIETAYLRIQPKDY